MDYQEKYLKYKTKYLNLKSQEKSFDKIIMTGGNNKEKATLYLFKAEWCPHCISFKPTWENLIKNFESKVNFVMYDSEKNASECKENKIEGYPTLILKTKSKAIEFVGHRDFNSVKEFIENETYNN
jgi:thiol-disulfide isomerase/thioredoxin